MQTNKRNSGIDILRGLSILLVLLLHLNLRMPFNLTFIGEKLPANIYSFIFRSGQLGVCVFFVISGFLITQSALSKWESLPNIDIKQFYFLRIARIMPLLILLLAVLSVFHLLQIPFFTINEERTSLVRALFAALTFHINWLEIKVGYLPGAWDVLWSLSIEETFYLFFPLTCLLLKNEKYFLIITIIFLLVSPWARTQLFIDNTPVEGDRNHLAYIDAILLGCVSALACVRLNISPKLIPVFAVVGSLGVIFIFAFRSYVFDFGFYTYGLNISILAISSAFLLIWLQCRTVDQHKEIIRPLRWLQWLGRNSYEIYLSHMFVVFGLLMVFRFFNLEGEWTWLFFVIGIFLSAVLGELLATYFSNPVNRSLRARMKQKYKV